MLLGWFDVEILRFAQDDIWAAGLLLGSWGGQAAVYFVGDRFYKG